MQLSDYRRFTVAVKLNSEERDALRRLEQSERLPAAQVVRKLIWTAAQSPTLSTPKAPASEGVHAMKNESYSELFELALTADEKRRLADWLTRNGVQCAACYGD